VDALSALLLACVHLNATVTQILNDPALQKALASYFDYYSAALDVCVWGDAAHTLLVRAHRIDESARELILSEPPSIHRMVRMSGYVKELNVTVALLGRAVDGLERSLQQLEELPAFACRDGAEHPYLYVLCELSRAVTELKQSGSSAVEVLRAELGVLLQDLSYLKSVLVGCRFVAG